MSKVVSWVRITVPFEVVGPSPSRRCAGSMRCPRAEPVTTLRRPLPGASARRGRLGRDWVWLLPGDSNPSHSACPVGFRDVDPMQR